jgi:tetratricopeptide (TPR) repeat protein
MGKKEPAESEYKAIISAWKEYAPAYMALGYLTFDNGKFDESANAFRTACEADTASWNARLGLALTLFSSGDVPAAQTILDEAIALEPEISQGSAFIKQKKSEGFFYSGKTEKAFAKMFKMLNLRNGG